MFTRNGFAIWRKKLIWSFFHLFSCGKELATWRKGDTRYWMTVTKSQPLLTLEEDHTSGSKFLIRSNLSWCFGWPERSQEERSAGSSAVDISNHDDGSNILDHNFHYDEAMESIMIMMMTCVSTSLMQFFLDPLNPITCFWISCGVTCIHHLHIMMIMIVMMMMMIIMIIMMMMKHLYSASILLNHRRWRLPLISRHSRKERVLAKAMTMRQFKTMHICQKCCISAIANETECSASSSQRFPPKYWSRTPRPAP